MCRYFVALRKVREPSAAELDACAAAAMHDADAADAREREAAHALAAAGQGDAAAPWEHSALSSPP